MAKKTTLSVFTEAFLQHQKDDFNQFNITNEHLVNLPSKAYIDEKFGDMKLNITELVAQGKALNGRMGRLENWRWFITGGIAVIVVVFIPALGWLFLQTVHLSSQVAPFTTIKG